MEEVAKSVGLFTIRQFLGNIHSHQWYCTFARFKIGVDGANAMERP